MPPSQPVFMSSCTNQTDGCSCECCNLKLCDLSSSEIRKLRKLFSEYSGFDRKLSFPEFLKLIRTNQHIVGCCNLSPCFLKRCFEKGDLNCDGLINFDQFLYAYCLARPDPYPNENVCCQQQLVESRPCSPLLPPPPQVAVYSSEEPCYDTMPCYETMPCFDEQPCVEPVTCCTPEPYVEYWQPNQVFDDNCSMPAPPPLNPTTQCIYEPQTQFQTCHDPCNNQNQIINLPPLPPEVQKLLHRKPRRRTVMLNPDNVCSNDQYFPQPPTTATAVVGSSFLPPLSPDIERLLRKSNNRNRRRTYHRRY